MNKTYRADQSVNICLVLSRLRDSTVQPARLFLATKTSTFQTVNALPDNTLHDLVEREIFQFRILSKLLLSVVRGTFLAFKDIF